MTAEDRADGRFESLLSLAPDEPLDDEQWNQLGDLLSSDAQFCERYVELLIVDQLLQEECPRIEPAQIHDELQAILHIDDAATVQPSAIAPVAAPVAGTFGRSRLVQFINRPVVFSLISASSFIFAVLTFMAAYRISRPAPDAVATSAAAADESVARISGVQTADFDASPRWPVGTRLTAGHALEIESGLLEITFDRGARVIVKGPAQLVAHSEARLQLQSGRLTARVPGRARGFVVETPQTVVVDLGTEFGVAVDRVETYVEVFQGLVRAGPDGGQRSLHLTAGKAAVAAAAGETARPVAPRTRQFAGLRRAVSLEPEEAGTRLRLTRATASFSQRAHGPYLVEYAIDGDPGTQWAIYRDDKKGENATQSEMAVFHVAEQATLPADVEGWELCFTLDTGSELHLDHALGRFRLAVTDADQSEFADGRSDGGKLGEEALWTVLDPVAFTVAAATSPRRPYETEPFARLERLDDRSLLAHGGMPACVRYTVTARASLARITGVRLEVIEHPSLPHAGPGLSHQHGNFTLSEFVIYAQPLSESIHD